MSRSDAALRDRLRRAWLEHVASDYRQGLIGSGRGLQASLCRALRLTLPDHAIQVAPRGSDADGDSRGVVDLAVCRGAEVRAAVELAFVPQRYPNFHFDMHRLRELLRPGLSSRQDNGDSGPVGPQRVLFHVPAPGAGAIVVGYRPATDLVPVFAVIGRDDAHAIWLDALRQELAAGPSRTALPAGLLLLHGRIGPDGEARFGALPAQDRETKGLDLKRMSA